MKIFTHTETMRAWLHTMRKQGKTIGFIPTMGALHAGHLSLVKASKLENDISVCSLFVNPSQFNDSEDLLKYPRNHDVDMNMLNDIGCEVTFLPTVFEVYPPGLDTKVNVDLHGLDHHLEGKYRPGHFDGMMEVVNRLLQISQPHRLYMGQKDFQQQLIVRHMIEKLGLDVELITCPIIREDDGLAMSSRNARLTPEFRAKAPAINRALKEIVAQYRKGDILELQQKAKTAMRNAGLKVEYVAICNADTLQRLVTWEDAENVVVLTAAWAGAVRLIDNEWMHCSG